MWNLGIRKYFWIPLFIGFLPAFSFPAELKMFDPLTGTYQPPKVAREYKGSRWMAPSTYAVYIPAVIRSTGRNFFLKLELLDGVTFTSDVSPEIDFVSGPPHYGAVEFRLLHPAEDGGTYVEWLVTVSEGFQDYPPFFLSFAGVGLKVGRILVQGGSVFFQVSTRDALTGETIESPVQATLMKAVASISSVTVQPGDKRIDVATGRRRFWGTAGDQDSTSRLGLEAEWSLWRQDGSRFISFPTDDLVILTISGNLSRISAFYLGSASRALTEDERSASSVEFVLQGDQCFEALGMPFNFPLAIELVAVDVPIDPRTLTLDVAFDFGDRNYVDQELLKGGVLTTWSLNGTVLTAGYINGNANEFLSRLYLKNESSVPGKVTVEVFTLPTPGTGSVSRGLVELGTIASRGVAMVKVAEDVLIPLGIPTSYGTSEQANFALEVVLAVPDATGVVQTFRRDLSFALGMSTMNKVTSQLSAYTMHFPYP